MIKTFVGPMYSEKSESLIEIYKRMVHKELIMAFKPRSDKRDSNVIKSKSSETEIPAIFIDDLGEIKNYIINQNIHTIFIDEVEMLTGDARELLDLSVLYDIDIYIAGLNMTGEQKPFGIIGDVLAVSDEIVNKTGFCDDCNKTSYYSLYLGNEDLPSNGVSIGDENYVVLCTNCLRKRMNARNNMSFIRRMK